jgi:hypothetical protein
MRTEDDLRDALRLMSERALDAEPALVRERRLLRPRRLIAVAVVAAIVAAVIVVPQLLRRDARKEPVAPPAYGWQPFVLRLPAGWTRSATQLDPTSSSTAVSGPNGRSCTITVFKLGAFDPTRIGGVKQRLTINGQPGWSGIAPVLPGLWWGKPMNAAFWEYYPNGWAQVICGGGSSPAERSATDRLNRTIASAVVPGEEPELRSPATFGYLPDGFAVTKVAFVEKVDQPGDIIQVIAQKRSPGAKTREITLWLEWPRSGVTDEGEHLVVDGRPARFEGKAYLRVWYAGYDLQLSAEGAGLADPHAEVLKIKAEMTLAPPQDRAAWATAKVGL